VTWTRGATRLRYVLEADPEIASTIDPVAPVLIYGNAQELDCLFRRGVIAELPESLSNTYLDPILACDDVAMFEALLKHWVYRCKTEGWIRLEDYARPIINKISEPRLQMLRVLIEQLRENERFLERFSDQFLSTNFFDLLLTRVAPLGPEYYPLVTEIIELMKEAGSIFSLSDARRYAQWLVRNGLGAELAALIERGVLPVEVMH
ncbi:MAG TPA: hypothetical protein PLV25_07725, partial [Opitutales bacterium]|nr:hypothetical protein [Opitutales bacterium]